MHGFDRASKYLGAPVGQFIAVNRSDDGVAQITAALDRLSLRENTVVIYCSDHGDFMGEHGMQCKGGVFYDCLTRVPLIVSWPGQVAGGVREDSPVNLIDIVPTVLGLQGLDVPRSMHGEPLPSVVVDTPSSKPSTSTSPPLAMTASPPAISSGR